MSSTRRAAAFAVALFLSLIASAAAVAVPSVAASPAPAAPAAAPASQAPALLNEAPPAAATGYTYWGYYIWNPKTDAWDYATVGANDRKQLPEDGDAYGFRWALVVQDPRLPRAEPDFDAICAETPEASAGEKRIAFVLDYGADVDAPDGTTPPEPRGVCALVDGSYTVQQALQTVAEIRTGNGGLICAIDNYPAQGCGDTIKNAQEGPPDQPVALALPAEEPDETPAAEEPTQAADNSDDSDDGGFPWGVAIAGGVVVVLAFGALALRRRQA
jgi:hypothetical protein